MQTAQDLVRRGQYREALTKYQEFLARPTAQLTPELRGYVLSQIADVDNGLGDYAGAETRAREALRLLDGAKEAHTTIFAIAEDAFAEALRGEGNYFEENNVAEQAVSLARQTLDTLSPRLAILLTGLARALEDREETGHALKLYTQAAFIFAEAEEGNTIELGSAYANLANAYVRLGDPKKTGQAVNLALAIWKEVLPPNDA